MKGYTQLIGLWCLVGSQLALANDVTIENVYLVEKEGHWQAKVTLRHEDSGWEHYADAWRVMDTAGNLIATRILYHPHKNEQPFTRGLDNIRIPAGVTKIYVEAHDKVHGWNPQRVNIDLTKSSGDRYHIRRQ